jgi:hypothetical protein
VPARNASVETSRLKIARKKKQREPVRERDLRHLRRQRPSLHEVASGKGALELAVDPDLARHTN